MVCADNVYYQLLRQHCDDIAVQGMCDLVIRDETIHIAFHRDRLASDGKSRRYGAPWSTLLRMMGLAAGTMLWVNHSPALNNLGATTGEFYRGIWSAMGSSFDSCAEIEARNIPLKRSMPNSRVTMPRILLLNWIITRRRNWNLVYVMANDDKHYPRQDFPGHLSCLPS